MKSIVALASLAFASSAFAQAPGVFTDLGTLNFNATPAAPNIIASNSSDFNAGEVKWYRFTIGAGDGIADQVSRFLDIYTTQDPTSPEDATQTDSEIGLYSDTGNLITNDDDSGASAFSLLTFGLSGTVRTIGAGGSYVDAQPAGTSSPNAFDGSDLVGAASTLAAGNYWLALGRFNTTYGATNWNVTSASTSTSDNRYLLRIGTGQPIPEPSTMALLLLAAPAIAKLRRKK